MVAVIILLMGLKLLKNINRVEVAGRTQNSGCYRAVSDQGVARGGWMSKVMGGKAAVSGSKSCHLRRQFHRSLYYSCKSCTKDSPPTKHRADGEYVH